MGFDDATDRCQPGRGCFTLSEAQPAPTAAVS
jgi:hypothetical protein